MREKYVYIMSIIIALITAVLFFIEIKEDSFLYILKIIFWGIFIFLLPGYFLTLSFFKKNDIDSLERFVLSFALSISIVPLLSFYLNIIWVNINIFSVYVIVSLIILICIYLENKYINDYINNLFKKNRFIKIKEKKWN